jgi:N-acetylglucosamine kinase-like BadF-type ATPase
MHVLGIDAGGTKTVCMLADAQGGVLGEARGPGANLQSAGELAVEKVLHDVMEATLADRPIVPAAICLGIAGVDRPADAAVVGGIMRRIGFKARVLVVNDALVALEAGAPGSAGIVIIAGTGSIAYGRNAAGWAARAGGWGYVLGDEGSGYWMGRLALRAVVRAADGRGPATSLTPRVLAHFGVARPEDLIHEVYHGGLRPAAIGALAALVQEARDEGDRVASGILEGGAGELVASAASVADRLGLREAAFPIILAGGIFHAVPWLAVELEQRLPAVAPRADVRRLAVEPAVGAVRLAVAELHGGAALPRYR